MNNITYRGRTVGRIQVKVVQKRPDFPIVIRHGYNSTLLPDGDDRDQYYAEHYELHQAASMKILTLPQAPSEVREYPRGHSPEGFGRLWMKTTVYFDTGWPESLARDMIRDNSPSFLYTIVPLVRQAVLKRLNQLAGDSTDHIQISGKLADEMLKLGIAPIRPYHPIYKEWLPAPAKNRRVGPRRGVRTLCPVLLQTDERLNEPNLSVSAALVQNTELTPVIPSGSWTSSTHQLPTAVLRNVSCSMNGRHVPAKYMAENTLADALELTIDLMSPEDIETIRVKAPFFLDSPNAADRLFTGRRGMLLVSAEAKTTVEEVMRHITPVLSRPREDEYRTSLIQMLLGPKLASETALRYITSRSMRSLMQTESAIEEAIVAGESVRQGNYLVTYQPEEPETTPCPCH